ncbi:MAG: hypothetical protein VX210_03045 [Myxococcota bacterium]|nr:hypothetical protein [Myxococcota bacterium]
MKRLTHTLVLAIAWLPTLAIAGGNAAGGGVRSVSVDFFGLEIALLTGLWLVSRRS